MTAVHHQHTAPSDTNPKPPETPRRASIAMSPSRRSVIAQTSLLELPTADPAAAIVWETREVTWPRQQRREKYQFYRASLKGHVFQVGRFPLELAVQTREPPPSQWTNATWQLHADFDPGGPMEFMGSLPGAATTEEALAMAENRIRGFLKEKRRMYD